MNRRWLISRTNPDYVDYLSKAASISPLLSQVLINRGIKTPVEIAEFLNPGLASLSDPFDLIGMKIAVDRVKVALNRNERILVHGDYDTDGLTATAIMVHALRSAGADVRYFIPNRLAHGYGFNPSAVTLAKEIGAKLIITVDCGITSFDAALSAKKLGTDLVITDHHEPAKAGSGSGETGQYLLPDAIAIVNPKLGTGDPRQSMLSGAGIAFKVAQALAADGSLRLTRDDVYRLLDLAALGTVADVVPLKGENRAILKVGLAHVQDAYRPGIRSLLRVSGLQERAIRAGLLSFTMVPRINASGRIGDAADVVNLFLSDTEEETLPIAEKLDRTNSERQRIEEEVYQEAHAQLKKKGYNAAIVLIGADWHAGVIGIVASRIAEKYNRPTFVFTIEGDMAKGSVRSISAFDVYNGLLACEDILSSFGGHKQAAGVKLAVADISRFEERINAVVRNSLSEEDLVPTIAIDSEVVLPAVNVSLVREFSMLEPVGAGNPEPVLGAKQLAFHSHRVVGSNHLKLKVKQRSLSLDAIGFDMGHLFEHLDSLTSLDAAFTPTINEWNGSKHVQLHLKAIRPGL